MKELMKDKYYNKNTVYELATRIKKVYSIFQMDSFIGDVMDETWNSLELKARMRQITINLGKYLPNNYEQAINILNKTIDGYEIGNIDSGLLYFPDFVEIYGQDEKDWDLSMAALEKYTKYSTAEFAVRPFIINNETKMMNQMQIWAEHENEHVRRLASEGCRPALPWGQALVSFKKNPLPVIDILKKLKDDSSLYVRKSVANNLNDISKTHPDLIIKLAKEWYGKSERTDWIIKHGCRSLLKSGNQEALKIFGFVDTKWIIVNDFSLNNKAINIGEDITFSFQIIANKAVRVRLEYQIDYVKANNKLSSKVFKISEPNLRENERKTYVKKHSFSDVRTRKHYPGKHFITLIVNGIKYDALSFELQNPKYR